MEAWTDIANEILAYNKRVEDIVIKKIEKFSKWDGYYIKRKKVKGNSYYYLEKKKEKVAKNRNNGAGENKTTSKENMKIKKEKYLGKENNVVIAEIQEYNICKSIKNICRNNIRCIEKNLKVYKELNKENVEQKLKNIYRNEKIIEENLFKTNHLSDWKKKGLEKRDSIPRFYPEKLIHKTDDGEMVRTRGEILFSNILYSLGIDYVYELPCEIGGQIKIPDFTVLDPDTGEEILIEYMGMYGDESYRLKNTLKINEYFKAGYVLGKNLFVFMDGEEGHFDSRMIRRMLKAIAGK